MRRANGLRQFGGRDVFQQKAYRTGLQRALYHGLIMKARQHDDLRCRITLTNEPGGGHTVHARHFEVHQHYVGPQKVAALDGLFTAVGLANKLQVRVDHEELTQPTSNDRVVVN